MSTPEQAAETEARRRNAYRLAVSIVVVNAVVWIIWGIGSDHSGIPWPVWVSIATAATFVSRVATVLFGPKESSRNRNRNRARNRDRG